MAVQRRRRSLVWDEVKILALDLVFEGRKSYEKIASDCTIPARTLKDWIAHPDFKAALEAKRSDLISSLDSLPYIRKERRLIGLAQMAESARLEYEARPLLIERRPTGRDTDGEMMYLEQEAFNREAHAAFRDALNDIAKELGERSSNIKISGNIEHSLVPIGPARSFAQQMLEAVRDIPDAREALSLRLLASGE
jgi:transposase-like protein